MGSLWNRSGTVERYADDLRAVGAKAYFFQGGTTTPLTVYHDSFGGSAHPRPVVADANGRWPDIFVPFVASYDVQVTSADDVQLTFTREIPNFDPSGGVVVVPPSVGGVTTGMIHAEFTSGAPKTGYVRLNGKTIGSATSGASEMGAGSGTVGAPDYHADPFNLYKYLWESIDPAFGLVPDRGLTSAEADFDAGKKLTLPDLRCSGLTGVDDMGNTHLGFFDNFAFNEPGIGTPIRGFSSLGLNNQTLALVNIPAHDHGGSVVALASTATEAVKVHSHTIGQVSGQPQFTQSQIQMVGTAQSTHTHLWGSSAGTGQGGEFTTAGGGAAHKHIVPDLTVTTFGGIVASGGSNCVTSVTYATTYGGTFTDQQTTGGGVAASHTHTGSVGGQTLTQVEADNSANHRHQFAGFTDQETINIAHGHGFSSSSKGGNPDGSTASFNNIPLVRLVTWYIKL